MLHNRNLYLLFSPKVFRILENPEEKFVSNEELDRLETQSQKLAHKLTIAAKKNLKLRDMYRSGCFEAAYPLHAGSYKYNPENTNPANTIPDNTNPDNAKTKWDKITLGKYLEL